MNRYSIEARDDGRYQVRTTAAIEGAAGTVVVILHSYVEAQHWVEALQAHLTEASSSSDEAITSELPPT